MIGSNKTIAAFLMLAAAALLLSGDLLAQKPIRVGTTAAEFLSIGYGSAGCAMGDAYVGVVDDISGVYWNPAVNSCESGPRRYFHRPCTNRMPSSCPLY